MTIDTVHPLLHELELRVTKLVMQPDSDDFELLATEVAQLQATTLRGYSRLFESRQIDPTSFNDWRKAPPIPTSAFQHRQWALKPAERIFRSSGTTQGSQQRSEHHHANLDLYRLIVDHSFPAAVLGAATPSSSLDPLSPRPILSLIAPLEVINDSSLGFMTDHVLSSYGDDTSAYAFRDQQLDFGAADAWLRTTPPGSRPILLTTALALWSLLESIEEHGATQAWPADLTIMETGGFKTRRFELTRTTLLDRLQQTAQVAPSQVVREYGMTELSSQAYAAQHREGGDADVFELPPWVRVRALAPDDMRDLKPGEPGLLAFFDLGNVASAASIVTEDIGSVEEGRHNRAFRLHGRAADAQLRGCSLTTETLLHNQHDSTAHPQVPR